ncbi:hypothetical protein, partial [Bathymodiolus azoricus thioautotrophic gill symbiont]|uniref:hypothetical protein n=1 Tax=Bathymodiolus azoricus thioautotrophic gill symbiont TaxID=235205 RepID=UPI0019D3C84D
IFKWCFSSIVLIYRPLLKASAVLCISSIVLELCRVSYREQSANDDKGKMKKLYCHNSVIFTY